MSSIKGLKPQLLSFIDKIETCKLSNANVTPLHCTIVLPETIFRYFETHHKYSISLETTRLLQKLALTRLRLVASTEDHYEMKVML